MDRCAQVGADCRMISQHAEGRGEGSDPAGQWRESAMLHEFSSNPEDWYPLDNPLVLTRSGDAAKELGRSIVLRSPPGADMAIAVSSSIQVQRAAS